MNADPASTLGHNRGPITAPSEADWLADLQRRYSEIPARLADFKTAAADYPDHIPLNQPEVAEACQDLLAQMAKEVSTWDAWEKTEKGPWNALVNVTKNFFTKPSDEVGWKETAKKPGAGLIGKLGAVYKDYLDRKEIAARQAAEAELERQREAADAARLAQEAAEREAAESRRRAEEERRKEQEAREAAEKAQREREEAEARAAAAKVEERRLAAEKAERDRTEKEANVGAIREIKAALKDAERLNTLAEAEEATDDEIKALEELVRPGGGIAHGGVWASPLLDEDQRAYLDTAKARVIELREIGNARYSKREQTRRAKEAAAAAEAEAKLVGERRQAREAEEKAIAEARTRRETEEAAAEAARADKKKAEDEARKARTSARTEEGAAKAADKTADRHETEADRATNRADRHEQKLENAAPSDFNQTRGDLGSVGGTRRQWVPLIHDLEALRATMGPLGPHVNEEAVSAAVTKFMRVNQGGFEGDRVEGMLPGVTFTYERDFAIRH